MAKSSNRIRITKRLGAYLASGAGSLGMIPAAEARVVPINIASFGLNGPNAGVPTGQYIRVNNFPVAVSPYKPTVLYAKNGYLGGFGLSSTAGYSEEPIYFAITSFNAASPKKFLNNQSVGSDSFFSLADIFTAFKNNYDTSPDFAANNYMGFRFGTNGNYNYGYLEVTWTSATNTFEIKSAAYESTPNTPILAGAASGGGAVPEPASGAIAALLMGGTALRQWRKKRHQESNEAVAS